MPLIAGAVLVLIVLQSVLSANILFVAITPSVSHQKVFQPIWKELSLRGHRVHTVTTDPLRDPALTNLTEYDLSSLYHFGGILSSDTVRFLSKKPNFWMVFQRYNIITHMASMLGELAFQHEQLQRLLKSDIKFDAVVAEWLFPTMGALGAKCKCPLIGITSLGASTVSMDTVGNPSHPISVPDHSLPVTRDMPLRDRVMSVLYCLYMRVYYHLIVLPREDRVIRKYVGEDLPYIGDIERNVSVLFLNRNPVFHKVMPVVPALIEFGGVSVKRSRSKLDWELQRYLDNSKQGVIYFSLGSNVRTVYLPDNLIHLLLKVFKQLPYNVLFKWENDTLPGKPDNVFILKWVPQLEVLDDETAEHILCTCPAGERIRYSLFGKGQLLPEDLNKLSPNKVISYIKKLDLLGHSNVRLFITQGGLQSSEEAIQAGVPIIGFPMVNDQTSNVDTFVKYGAGIALDMDYLTAEELNSTIYEIMTNPSYKKNVQALAILMYDQPVNGLERAVWWIEYVIRHKGARHLRSPILDIPWWQYFMLDVIGFLLAILIIVLTVCYRIWKILTSY